MINRHYSQAEIVYNTLEGRKLSVTQFARRRLSITQYPYEYCLLHNSKKEIVYMTIPRRRLYKAQYPDGDLSMFQEERITTTHLQTGRKRRLSGDEVLDQRASNVNKQQIQKCQRTRNVQI